MIAFADKKGDEVQKKLSDAIGTIQGVLTGLIVAVGIVVALWIIIKRLPSAERERLQLSTQSDVTERLLWPAPQSGQRKAVKTKNVRFCGYGPAPFGALPAHA